jgi:uncharacterized membrane protein HdeD (DUF308 family)
MATMNESERMWLSGNFFDIEELRHNWGWLLAMGIGMIVLGVVALGAPIVLTLVTTLFFGWLLLLGGAVQIIHGFWARRWSGFFVHLVTGILAAVVGLLIISSPAAGALSITLLLAAFFIAEGIARIMAALMYRFSRWGWLLAVGMIDLILGILIWTQWPVSGLWVIGLFVGIDLIFYGSTWVMLALAARNLPRAAL